ncbi:Crp/Fnr family transcriptional regulator [Haoranjiania flava]|uniref:Crp/Fnr family transcriptional regulator n=1 Tax=Haoranjiania flava TaxID=1856322 RepID=A0AAE3LKI3_9BACT|nr:Crp/Fnr family transcriptional regulator [Haoranjiania flava]MCU7694932.1 Crp/Fnr family transcriptional regulator [Haoranjiania flava]
MFEQIKNYINKCEVFSEEEILFFQQSLSRHVVPKKTLLLRDGEVCHAEIFVLKGCLKSYFIDDNGFEVILTFAVENWWASDMKSFTERVPSNMFIETIEDSELLYLTYEKKETLLAKYPRFERVFRLMVQRHLVTYQERLFKNISAPAKTRYLDFIEKYPDLPQRVPQHLIASYIGISPEFLSKIRKELAATGRYIS